MPTGNAVRRNFVGMMRCCSSCGSEIEVTETMVRRRIYRCSACETKQAVEYARRNRAKKREWNNAYYARISDKRAEKTAAYRGRYPEKRAAHQAVQIAIRNGTLAKKPCEVCGVNEVHAHHDDYSRPLGVRWLCHAHHMERHAMLAAREGGEGDVSVD